MWWIWFKTLQKCLHMKPGGILPFSPVSCLLGLYLHNFNSSKVELFDKLISSCNIVSFLWPKSSVDERASWKEERQACVLCLFYLAIICRATVARPFNKLHDTLAKSCFQRWALDIDPNRRLSIGGSSPKGKKSKIFWSDPCPVSGHFSLQLK